MIRYHMSSNCGMQLHATKHPALAHSVQFFKKTSKGVVEHQRHENRGGLSPENFAFFISK